ncbi:Ankyrin repeat-containing protein [Glarea lozoyensis ATCC 20868]|uniref:Ankyrin repeat-containing protein n=1 Tax=Glarea lozoyensis (strain ATCC 20868 / MF5171) TaxID=1116229 RepID=S3DIW2_GLAL2|nr:Ankyrin repeat-containing protein [Glarea lozoyensis ATCC 20868]EPE37094.1 Ankyrin repeat-containing protein [Glarea lozoyensis ATCC 20868]
MEMMEKRKEEITRRPLYVYDLPKDILTNLVRKEGDGPAAQEDASETDSTTDSRPESRAESSDGSKSCSLCGVMFYNLDDQRRHVRSDLHGYNLKQRLRGAKPVTENEFEKLVGDLDESLSGEDSTDSEEEEAGRKETTLSALLKKQAAISTTGTEEADDTFSRKRKRGPGKAPVYWFTNPILPPNTYLGIYRAIFSTTEQENEGAILDIIQQKQLKPKPQKAQVKIPLDAKGVPLPEAYKEPHIFMCMIGGGHFAAMVVALTPKQTKHASAGPLVKEATVIAHKTFHRYTTRRKQGGSQSANDSAKGAAHSAGAGIRRYNEQALIDEVRQLLLDWKGMIDTSELLFVRATGTTNRRTLFGPYEDQVLHQNDPRVRAIPFNTRRATQNELLRAYVELTRVKVLEVDEAAILATKQAAEAKQVAKAAKPVAPAAPKRSEEEETALLHTTQIQALIRRSKLPALLSYLKSNELSPDFRFSPPDTQQNYHAPTPLHLASSLNSTPLITGLLAKAGADPTIKNNEGKTAFEIAGDRQTRDAFRVARHDLGESAWLWDEAKIPAPISRAEAESRDKEQKAEESKIESERRKAELERLKTEGPQVSDSNGLGKAAGRGRQKVLGEVAKTAQQKREEEARGLTPEMRMKLDRERRARAAEERMKKLAGGS